MRFLLTPLSVSQPPDWEHSSWSFYFHNPLVFVGFSFTVKPLPPFNVQVKDTDGFYNITWSNNNSHLDCFTYRVRIRESQHPKVTPAKTSATLPFLLIILTQTFFIFFPTGSSSFPSDRRAVYSVGPQQTEAASELFCGCSGQNVSWEPVPGSVERVESCCRLEDDGDVSGDCR